IRWCPSTSLIVRFAVEDFDYHGTHIAAGTPVMIAVYPTHRDPRAVADGDTFDITAGRQFTPLLFGGGAHHCLGAALARTALSEALPVLTSRLGPPRRDLWTRDALQGRIASTRFRLESGRAGSGGRVGPGVGQQGAGVGEQLGQHPGVADHRHEVGVT